MLHSAAQESVPAHLWGLLLTSASDPDERRHRQTILLTAILGAIGLAVPIGLFVVQQNQPDTPEEHAAACRKAHDAPLKLDMSAAERRYGDCSWPPVPGATEDGYYEITVTEHEIPGTAAFHKYTSIQVFESKCTTYQLRYKYESQGTTDVQEPLLIDSDQIVSVYTGEAVNMYEELEGLTFTYYEPGPGRLVVLTHGRYRLHEIKCVNPDQASNPR